MSPEHIFAQAVQWTWLQDRRWGRREVTKAHAEAEKALEHSSALGNRIKHLVSIHALPSLTLKVHWRKAGPEKRVFLGKQEEESLGVYHLEISNP